LDEKLYLSVSLIVSALVLSGTIFLVGDSVNDNLTGLTVAIQNAPAPVAGTNDSGSGDTGTVAPQEPTPPSAPTIDMEALLDDDEFEGNADAPITIVEFSDFECPFCGRFYTDTLGQLREKYVETGKVKIIFRDFPLSFHPEATPAAEASECAADQGKFWEFHDLIFENQTTMSAASYKQWAADLGLDTEQFNSCVDDGTHAAEVRADFAAGQAAGVSGTPTFFINGQKVVGAQPFSVFEQIIEAELAE
tara:strand:+ start:7374 stop:8120 length:747 start_codon:yes stop_codon:yes gene_type:complete